MSRLLNDLIFGRIEFPPDRTPQWPWPVTARPPVKCPVCEGRGTVEHGFYAELTASNSTSREKCRSCNGRGIL